MAGEIPLPTKICAKFHLQAWAEPDGALHIRLTDGLRGWEARLDSHKLRKLADENNFVDDDDGDGAYLEQYRELTLSSLTSCVADCTFSADIDGAGATMRWSRVCLVEGNRERVSGVAFGAESQTAFRALRSQLAARLNASASTVGDLETSIAEMGTRMDRTLAVTHDLRRKIATLREDRAARFFLELNEKKRALEAALDDGSDSGSDVARTQTEGAQDDGAPAGTDAPAVCPPSLPARDSEPDGDHAMTDARDDSGFMSLLQF